MSIASIVLTPEIVAELGYALDGMIVVSPTVPPNDSRQPRHRRVPRRPGGDRRTTPTTRPSTSPRSSSWSNIKKLEEALLAAGGPRYVASLDSAGAGRGARRPPDRPPRGGALRLPREPAPRAARPGQLPGLHPGGRHPRAAGRRVPAPRPTASSTSSTHRRWSSRDRYEQGSPQDRRGPVTAVAAG